MNVLTILALVILQPTAALIAPTTLWVGEGRAYPTPAAALADARPGDTIRVAAGVYRGGFVVSRRITLVGEPGAVLEGAGEGDAVTLAADSITLEGFEIRGSGRSLDHDYAAVKVKRCTGCRVVGNTIGESLHGVYLLESSGVEVRGNRIDGDPQLAEARRGNGIHLFNSAGNTLAGNVIRGTRDGIYFSFAAGNDVVENDVAQVRYGLHYMYSDGNRFRGNRFTRNAAGAAIMYSKDIVFRENVFADHVGYRAYGILLQTAESITAERNRIEGNLVGIFLDNATRNVFRENLIAGNGTGVDLLTSAEANTFAGNALIHNRTAVRKAVGGGENAWAEGCCGNYWGERAAFDLDGDGVGDRPYEAGDPFASMAALRPVLELFVGTPAARVLSWAERAFPVFDFPKVHDPAPLVRPPAGVPMTWKAEGS